MVDSLRDQLLKCGLKPPAREPARPPSPRGPKAPASERGKPGSGGGKARPGNPPHPARQPRKDAAVRSPGEIDLARAYAIRAQTEAQERKRSEREAAEQARIKRENKRRVEELLQGQALNRAEADQVRHFEYGGKIRRVHVDTAQLAALNAGELGVVQHAGRYVLVGRAIAEQVQAIEPRLVALLVDPQAAADDDGVPDDLMW